MRHSIRVLFYRTLSYISIRFFYSSIIINLGPLEDIEAHWVVVDRMGAQASLEERSRQGFVFLVKMTFVTAERQVFDFIGHETRRH
jgi:hypothetical protein